MEAFSGCTGDGPVTLLQQGAEARVYRAGLFAGAFPCVVKERFKKEYRHPALDKQLTQSRLIAEARLLGRCRRAGIPCPAVYYVDSVRARIYMEDISDGTTLKSVLEDSERGEYAGAQRETLARAVGALVARLHDADMVHGDLTTSNIMLRPRARGSEPGSKKSTACAFEVVLIDFGLAATTVAAEDRAVDLYVLQRALRSSHAKYPDFMDHVLGADGYQQSKRWKETHVRLKEVQLRGRKRLMAS